MRSPPPRRPGPAARTSRRSSSTTCTGPAAAPAWRSTSRSSCATPSWQARSRPSSPRCTADRSPVVSTAPVVVVGDICADVVALLSGEPAPGSDRTAEIATRGGGAGANVAALLAALGAPVVLAGCVGNDLPGRTLCRDLAAAGVTLAVRAVPDAPTGSVISLVEPGGERSMLADRGANLALQPGDVPTPLPGGHL